MAAPAQRSCDDGGARRTPRRRARGDRGVVRWRRHPACAALVCAVAVAQDPLQFYGDGPPAEPRGPQPQGMNHHGSSAFANGGGRNSQLIGAAPARGGPVLGSPWVPGLVCLVAGAGATRLYGARRERLLRRSLESTRTALDFKRLESQQLAYKVQQMEYQVRELQQALYESEAESLRRDYDEFKAPDVDDDDRISADEFAAYIANYMKAYPQIPEADYPVFHDFDQDTDGAVTFKEWQAYLQQQQQQQQKDGGSAFKKKQLHSSSPQQQSRTGV